MAKFYLMIIFISSLSLMVKTGESYFQILKSFEGPIIGSNYAPIASPVSSEVQYLKNCAGKLRPPCGTKIFFGTFVGNETISAYCCHNLVNDVGRRCHVSMTVYAIINTPEFKQKKTQILKRSKQIFKKCKASNSHGVDF
ncbi:putative Prolamin-like domain-containing protein [Lupinus albus]|uniref:Putative Prolamin-like domain-containing protein n=1 Tax=Lupinus albus TaxID=3870 RepID=A0A6A4R7B1_LUPAL|nr:putative Prolamin-like domain-containing protein [Lupinus albus]